MRINFPVLEKLNAFERLGVKDFSDGSVMIGRAPHIAPQAWLHRIYRPLNMEEINLLEKGIGKRIPGPYKEFLKHSNGLGIFNTTFCLYGLKISYDRLNQEINEPFDIVDPNKYAAPVIAPTELVIGGYDWDDSLLLIDQESGLVSLRSNKEQDLLYEWSSFNEMLEWEVKRLFTLFDDNGKEKDKNQSTLPKEY